MLSQPFRCITKKSRSFQSQSQRFLTKITPFSQSTSTPSIIPYQYPNPSSESHKIATSFKDWFTTARNPKFDRIFEALNSNNEHDLTNIDLGLKLDEKFMLNVLRYKRDDILSCLKFFDWAGKQLNFRHSRSTYVAIFKILSRAKLNDLMLDLLDGFGKDNFMQGVRHNDILVIGYALAGKLDTALLLFGKIQFQGTDLDPVAYHILLNALVEGGCFDAVKVVLNQIRVRGHENKVTRPIVVKSMCKQGHLDEAEEYVRGLVERGECVSGQLFSTLVESFGKEKMFSRVSKLIEEFGEKGDNRLKRAYGIWIRDLVRNEQLDEALGFFNAKKSLEGYVPDVHRYNILISRLLRQERLHEVCNLLMEMKESNISPDKVTMNSVLCFFCKAGMMDVAIELCKGSSEFGLSPNSMVYNYIVNTLCGDGNTMEAYQVLKSSMSKGYFPGSRTFSILANALCREGRLDKMKDLIMFALERKFIPAKATYERFIIALCRVGRVEDGYLIHGELNRLNMTMRDDTYAHLIYGFSKASRGDLAGRLLIEMQEKGYKPSHRLFKAVLRRVGEMEDDKFFLQLLEMQLSRYGHDVPTYSYFIYGAGHAGKPELGRAVFEMMEKCGLVPSLNSDIYMIKSFLKRDRIGDAMSFFVDIPRRRKIGRKLYNSMVVGLCRIGKADYAAAILREAKNKRQTLSLESYEELIKLYCTEYKFDHAMRIINDLEKSGRRISSFIGNCLLFYSLHSGDVYKAWVRSRGVSEETPASKALGQLVAAFTDYIRLETTVEELEEIVSKCFPLDLFTYNVLLRKLTIDHMDKACQLFKRICRKGIKPNRWTYVILVRGLYKHGRIAEGQLLTDEMHRRGYMVA